MSKEEFVALQQQHQQSGKSLKGYLKEINVGYSAYNSWRKKYLSDDIPHNLAPITFTEPKEYTTTTKTPTGCLPSGATLPHRRRLPADGMQSLYSLEISAFRVAFRCLYNVMKDTENGRERHTSKHDSIIERDHSFPFKDQRGTSKDHCIS
ncbi:MAG: hypothetical protein ACI353_02895 [Alloprevotella sp.]